MKIKTTILALSISTFAFAVDIPEAGKLHPEKFTIQLVVAELPSDFDANALHDQYMPKDFGQLSEKEKWDAIYAHKKAIIDQIKKSDGKISTCVTIHSKAGVEFSDDNGIIKGKLDSESNTIDIIQLDIPDYGTTKPLTIDAKPNQWFSMILGRKHFDKEKRNYCVLIKCYPPAK